MRVTCLVLLLVLVVLQGMLLGLHGHTAPTLLVYQPDGPFQADRPDDPAYNALAATASGRLVLSRLTADDLARGIWALAEQQPPGGLSAQQKQDLFPMLQRAQGIFQQLARCRTQRRAARARMLNDAMDLAKAMHLAIPGGLSGTQSFSNVRETDEKGH